MIKIYFDGCAGPTNPGYGGAGVVIVNGDQKLSGYWFLGKNRTNNEAEYAGLIYALRLGIHLGFHTEPVTIYGDSKLIINQVTRQWKNKKPHLQQLMKKADIELAKYKSCNLEWIPRDLNTLADKMSVKPLLENGIKIRK